MAAMPLPFPTGGEPSAVEGDAPPERLLQEGTTDPQPLDRLLSACAELQELAALDWTSQVSDDAKTAVKALEQISRITAAIQANVLSAAETNGKWALDGQRTFDSWLSSQTGTTRGTAGRAVKLSKSLKDDLPGTREALANGEISTDHAQIIARRCTKTDKHRKRLEDPFHGEKYLVERAKEMDAGKFSKVASAWAIETDPAAADRQWRQESAKEELILTPADDGLHISGFLNPVRGAILKEALSAHMGRKAQNDLRPFNERQADGLIGIASQSLDAGLQLPNARIRPHLSVTLEYDTLERLVHASGSLMPHGAGSDGRGTVDEGLWAQQWQPGDDHAITTTLDYDLLEGATPAQLPDGTPIPHKVLARLACESMLTRIVFGPDSTILNVGREQRIFTKPQTRAIIARDRTCRYPGCDEGPGFGEIHHSISWAKHQGNTDVDLGVLLCYHHHDLVHERDITITRRRGEWVFTSRHGKEILPPAHGLAADSDPLGPPGSRMPVGGSPPSAAEWWVAEEEVPFGERLDDQRWEQPGFGSPGPPPF